MNLVHRSDFAADRRLLLITLISLFIGFVCSGVAWLLLTMIRIATNLFFFQQFSVAEHSPGEATPWGLWVILVPIVGSLIIGVMAKFGSEKIRGHGIPEALESILFGKSIMKLKVAILKPISSAISIGSGGPFGAEGPIIMTGGAFGSLLAQSFHLTANERKTLLVAGAAAGMTAIFATPLAAILLAVEVLLFEWRPRSLIPVAAACAVASFMRPVILGGSGPLFPVSEAWTFSFPVFLKAVALGLIVGALSSLISKALYAIEDGFHKLPIHWMWWPALGAIVVGFGGYFQPRVFGVGYDLISDFLQGHLSAGVAISLVFAKALVWLVALGSGTSGGVLAPVLIIGAGVGTLFASIFSLGTTGSWALIGMASMLSALMRAPLTSVIFALELTHDWNIVLGVLTACVSAYTFSVMILNRSILTEKIARRGFNIFCEFTVDPSEKVLIASVMTTQIEILDEHMTLQQVLEQKFTPHQKHRGYPILGNDKKLAGVVTLSDIVAKLAAGVSTNKTLREAGFCDHEIAVTFPTENVRRASEKAVRFGYGRLPVVDPEDKGKLVGWVTRSDLLKVRASVYEEDYAREKIGISALTYIRNTVRQRIP